MVDVRGEPHERFYRVRWKGHEEKLRTTHGRTGVGTGGTSKTEESTQSTLSGRRKTSLSGTSLLGSMAKFAAGTAARTGRSQELYSSPKRV